MQNIPSHLQTIYRRSVLDRKNFIPSNKYSMIGRLIGSFIGVDGEYDLNICSHCSLFEIDVWPGVHSKCRFCYAISEYVYIRNKHDKMIRENYTLYGLIRRKTLRVYAIKVVCDDIDFITECELDSIVDSITSFY